MQKGVIFRALLFWESDECRKYNGTSAVDCADRNRKAVTHAEGRAISGISILGVYQVPEIERDLDRADRNRKAVAHAEGRPDPGISILGVQQVPQIEQNNANTGLVTK